MRITLSSTVARAVIAGLLVTGALSAKPLAPGASAQSAGSLRESGAAREIQAPVSSSFGIYQPYSIPRYKADIGLNEPAIASNFSNIAVGEGSFPWASYFTPGERSMLQKNGFVARPEAIGSFGQAYAAELGSEPMGSFVTVDAVLHGLRVTTDEAIRDMERNYAAPALGSQLGDLSENIAKQLNAERSETLKESLTQLLAYVQTARALLTPSAAVDPRVQGMVSAEVKKIRSASGSMNSSIFPQRTIDYGWFAPSGHYRLDPQLENYYRAKVWLSHVGFDLRGRNGAPDIAGIRTASLLALLNNSLDAREDFRQTYRNINEPLAFFTGHAGHAASWDILTSAMRNYYGRIVEAGPGFLAEDASMVGFIEYLGDRIQERSSSDGLPVFRLVEWSSVPSREAFERVWSEQRAGQGRYGTTLMAAAGSIRASELLGAQSGFARGGSLSGRPAELWVQDLDNTILYTVQPLLSSARTDGYPRFMRSDAWRDRELSTALGAWADYQHDLATMPMRSIVKAGRVSNLGTGGSDGYVEPNPEAWGRVASLAGYIRSGLTEGRGERLIGRGVETKLHDIENVAAKLMQIAAAELDGEELTADQLALIKSMRDRIAAYETFSEKSLQGEGYTASAGASRIMGEESVANGHPLAIYVIVPRNDGEEGLMLTRGAIYSYYETDASHDEWLREITSARGSVKPDARLTGSFVGSDRSFTQAASEFYGVSAALPAGVAIYTPTKGSATRAKAKLDLESTVVSRTAGELWFTVRAPGLDGTQLVVALSDASGKTLQTSQVGSVKNGERLDVVRVSGLSDGEYLIRVEDMGGRQLASGRFLVVK